MPICEADPWRLQYFEHAACPAGVNIPTEDSDAWLWYPDHRWVYDKIEIEAGPHGLTCAVRRAPQRVDAPRHIQYEPAPGAAAVPTPCADLES